MSPIKQITSLADALDRQLNKVIGEAQDTITMECFKIYKKNLLGRKGWARRSYSNRSSADLDFENRPIKIDKAGQGYSVIDAISAELKTRENALEFFMGEGGGISGFKIGQVDELLRMSPRWIYYEYGTLGAQEQTGSLGIGSFGQWQNPYVPWSRLRIENPEIEWAFRKLRGVGRFGLGVMMPADTKGSTPVQPIPPIRMYRGSGEFSRNEIRRSQSKIIKTLLSKVRG